MGILVTAVANTDILYPVAPNGIDHQGVKNMRKDTMYDAKTRVTSYNYDGAAQTVCRSTFVGGANLGGVSKPKKAPPELALGRVPPFAPENPISLGNPSGGRHIAVLGTRGVLFVRRAFPFRH